MLSLTKDKNNPHFTIRRALEDTLKVFGERTMQAMIFELKVQAGINFDDPSLSLEKISKGLIKLYGDEVAQIIMEDVILKIEKIASEHQTDAS